MDRAAGRPAVQGVTQNQTQLSNKQQERQDHLAFTQVPWGRVRPFGFHAHVAQLVPPAHITAAFPEAARR